MRARTRRHRHAERPISAAARIFPISRWSCRCTLRDRRHKAGRLARQRLPLDTTPDFYVASRAHHADVGGTYPGSMGPCREIYQEGLRIPPVKIMRGGKIVADVLALLLNNVRTPEEREGDLGAQIAACQTGAQRLREICDRYGLARAQQGRRRSARLLGRNDARFPAHHSAGPLPRRRLSRRRWRRRQARAHRRDRPSSTRHQP